MLGFTKFLFKGGVPELSEADKAAIEAWRKYPAPALDEVHFHTRYVVLDIGSSGFNPQKDELTSIAASGVHQGTILPENSMFADLTAGGETPATVNSKLISFLKFSAKAPLVTYHVPYVAGFLQRAYKEHLGVDFQPNWIDLASLLPSMFEEKGDGVMPLDRWIEVFNLGAGEGRRNAMDNTLVLARLFQMLLVRANAKELDSAARLVDESRASSFLRRAH